MLWSPDSRNTLSWDLDTSCSSGDTLRIRNKILKRHVISYILFQLLLAIPTTSHEQLLTLPLGDLRCDFSCELHLSSPMSLVTRSRHSRESVAHWPCPGHSLTTCANDDDPGESCNRQTNNPRHALSAGHLLTCDDCVHCLHRPAHSPR